MRCIAHIVNLIVWDGLKLKNNLQAVERVRATIKFVKNSPARLQRLKDLVSVLKIERKSLLSLDVPTRWNSTYEMLETALKFKYVFSMFGLHKEIDLGDGETSNIGPPEDSDWDLVRKLIIFLERFFILTNNVSASLSVTANSALFDISTALETLKGLEEASDLDLCVMAHKMKDKFNKYWGNLDKFNMLIYVAAILDPNVKIVGLQFTLHAMYGENDGDTLLCQIQQVTYELFDEYKDYIRLLVSLFLSQIVKVNLKLVTLNQ
ncbi:zinc finger BED domain-containing protein RICESLEEPER 2-like [Apium graveolens]|uniref:zinc finger BED domain-containing protein RICESLEEPER 2-like n=1 Tax=Apium graveolens TaxID=4045 RepID=UPI003D7B5B00